MFIAELFINAPKDQAQPEVSYLEEARPQLVVLYPGRFQPFHLGHRDVFESLQAKYGRDSVYIATSNKTELPKSPFNFTDKTILMNAAGVPADRILEVASPYKLPAQFDPASTVFVVAVGAPDADRLKPGAYKKDGQPGYYQTFESLDKCETADKHGYVIIAAERKKVITIKGKQVDVSHGTESRNLWNSIRKDAKARAEFLTQMYGRNDPEVGRVLDKIPASQVVAEHIGKVQGGYRLYSHKGKNLGTFDSMASAKKHEREVQYFKHMGEDADAVEAWGYAYNRADQRVMWRRIFKSEEAAKAWADSKNATVMGTKVLQKSPVNEAGFDKEEFRRHMADLEAREELRKTDPVSAKALDLRGQLPQSSKKKQDDDSIGINDPRHPGYAYTQAGQHKLDEFAPDEGGGSRKFIPWTEFIEQLKQILHKDFSCKENIVKSTIKARFVPHDPMEYGPTMLYSYYETRAGGRNKGAISTRGSIQVGKYTKGGLFGHTPDQLLTGFHLLKGHPFERHFDLTFDNIYKIANIINSNTQGALEFKPEGIAEDAAGVGVVSNSKDPRYVMATMGDQNDVDAQTLPKEMKAYGLIGRKSPGAKAKK